jgi:hypothetical protein
MGGLTYCQPKVGATDFAVVNETSNHRLSLGWDVSKFISELGVPHIDSYREKENTFKRYKWDGIVAYCYDQGNGRVIRVEITAKGFLTTRGIKMGDDQGKIIERYGNPDDSGADKLVYRNISDDVTELHIGLDGLKKVSNIFLVTGD